ncbi:CPBP family intramembrane metalloprotease [Patescibacteria group bacterium]|nr:CPBP family intramembrane metalloprotease [Patescibacteria group bacterium]MBU1472241.1 CPBP family intramembrane metalloprotease [Patescibacteria group bacterium]MBU2460508.1 CPBP family intramembrane metalloprotease [Patescibacteria group bacterium]
MFKNKLFLIIETGYLFIFPLILLRFYPTFIHYRIYVLMGSLIYIFIVVYSQKITSKNLGLNPSRFFPATKALFIPTVLSMLLTFVFFQLARKWLIIPVLVEEIRTPSIAVSVLTYIFVSAPLQEFVYRGYLVSRLEIVSRNATFIKLYSAIIFMVIHTPFYNWFLPLGSLILGLLWTGNFLTYRNVYALMLSHTLIGATYIILMGMS